MGNITLASNPLARLGATFRYVGPTDDCEECNLKKICHNLIPGRYYKVIKIRDVEHPCAVHVGEKVYVVEVEELPLKTSIPQRKALEGALVTLNEPECPLKWCPNHLLCTVPEDIKGKKVSIKEIDVSLDCPRDLKLKKAIIEPK